MAISSSSRLSTAFGTWTGYALEDGLPDLKIECLHIDCQGMLWIGTHEAGVVRYDGSTFETFTTRDGLAGNGVYSIIEDRDGRLWFSTSQGLNRYDGHSFDFIPSPTGASYSCASSWASSMDQQGRLWFGVDDPAVVLRWDGIALAGIPLPGAVDCNREMAPIQDICTSAQGRVWLGGYAGLYYCDGEEIHTAVPAADLPRGILCLLSRDDGAVWAGTASGLLIYRDGRLVLRSDLCAGWITALWEDDAGSVWSICDGRLMRCGDDGFEWVGQGPDKLWRKPCRDAAGRLWLPTYGQGLYCYDSIRYQILGLDQGLPAAKVNCLAEDAQGYLLVGTEAGVVRRTGDEFCFFIDYESLPADGKETQALLLDDQQRLWLAFSSNLWLHEAGETRLVSKPFSGGRLHQLAKDRQGRIWLGFRYERGFAYCEDGRYEIFDMAALGGLANIEALLVDRQDRVWFGTWLPRHGEIYRFGCFDGQTVYPVTPEQGLVCDSVYALCEDREDALWIGTGAGVYRLANGDLQHFTRAEGLAHEIVKAIVQSRDGVMWFGTEGEGVACYDGLVFQSIRIPGGQACNTVNAIYQDSEDQLWFGTDGGLIRYTPQRTLPEIALTEIVADRAYAADGPLGVSTSAGRILFRFKGRTALDQVAHLVYRYRLQGHDSDWRQTRSTQIEYPPLKTGDYTFEVQAVDTDLNYSAIASVAVQITADPRLGALTNALQNFAASDFIGTSPALTQVQEQLAEVAVTDLTVLIQGETGTGKGLAARSVHHLSPRVNDPFIPINCGAIPEGLIESELFGHERGAFTGAVTRQLGKFELAEGGTLFLDEIGDLPLEGQRRLLQVLEERTYQRIGGKEMLVADVRVIAASNRDLERAVAEGGFRQDLYYRLCGFVLRLPPLSRRGQDIPLLVEHFAARFAQHLDRPAPAIDAAAMAWLQDYHWPGNVRELEHLIQRAVLLCRGNRIECDDVAVVPSEATDANTAGGDILEWVQQSSENGLDVLERAELLLLQAALERSGGNQRQAARLLGVDRKKVERRLQKYGLAT